MPINKIQFQPGLSLPDFFAQFGTEAQCEKALEKTRWPSGFVCPGCGGSKHSLLHRDGEKLWQCSACRKQTSLTAGTIFESTRLPLRLWFLGIYHLSQPKNNVSALELKRLLGINYKAAWRMKHKLMQVMDEREADRVLGERVEVDDAYLGGVHSGIVGRGAEGKVPFVIAVQTTEDEWRPWYVRLDPLAGFTKKALVQSRFQIRQVRRALPRGIAVSLQPSLRSAHHDSSLTAGLCVDHGSAREVAANS